MFVYFIRQGRSEGGGMIKIGHAKNIEQRIVSMQTGCPNSLNLIMAFSVGSKKQAVDIESELHYLYRDMNVRGEWFRGFIKLEWAVEKFGQLRLVGPMAHEFSSQGYIATREGENFYISNKQIERWETEFPNADVRSALRDYSIKTITSKVKPGKRNAKRLARKSIAMTVGVFG